MVDNITQYWTILDLLLYEPLSDKMPVKKQGTFKLSKPFTLEEKEGRWCEQHKLTTHNLIFLHLILEQQVQYFKFQYNNQLWRWELYEWI